MTQVPTARGDSIDSAELGFTLVTETIFNVTPEISANWPDISLGSGERLEGHIRNAIEILTEASRHGVDTIVDRVIPGLGRDVRNVKRIAEAVPLNIIVCTGVYTWRDLPHTFMFREEFGFEEPGDFTMEELFVRDIEEGIANTGVRAGMVKIVSDHFGLTPGVELGMRAGARAHRRTGVPLTTHTNEGARTGLVQQKLLEEEGVDLSRTIIGHMDKTPREASLDEFAALMDKGSYIAFDMVGVPQLPAGENVPETEISLADAELRISRIAALCERGYADRLLVSHDSCCWTDMLPEALLAAADEASGVPRYTQIHHQLIPALRERGVGEEQIEQITLANPRAVFETADAGPY